MQKSVPKLTPTGNWLFRGYIVKFNPRKSVLPVTTVVLSNSRAMQKQPKSVSFLEHMSESDTLRQTGKLEDDDDIFTVSRNDSDDFCATQKVLNQSPLSNEALTKSDHNVSKTDSDIVVVRGSDNNSVKVLKRLADSDNVYDYRNSQFSPEVSLENENDDDNDDDDDDQIIGSSQPCIPITANFQNCFEVGCLC